MSDSSSVQLYQVEETVWGTTPATALKEFRFTQESLEFNAQTAQSEEIRNDRQVSDIIRTSVNATGDVGIELSYGTHDDMLEGAFFNDWTTPVNVTQSLKKAPSSMSS